MTVAGEGGGEDIKLENMEKATPWARKLCGWSYWSNINWSIWAFYWTVYVHWSIVQFYSCMLMIIANTVGVINVKLYY
jgi:hypothetical protein